MASHSRHAHRGSGDTEHATALSALWSSQALTFPRLPDDAPAEIKKDTSSVDDLKHVYSIYHASRRLNFQLLVERFIIQIRYGCRNPQCSTPTCFTHRRHAAGSKPIRRYNATSARALACHLASQSNPDSALCPHINPRNEETFEAPSQKPPRRKTLSGDEVSLDPLKRPVYTDPHHAFHLEQSRRTKSGTESTASKTISSSASLPNATDTTDMFGADSEPVRIDSKSFVQNVFNTNAMKMLEWLTPAFTDNLAKKLKGASTSEEGHQEPKSKPTEIESEKPIPKEVKEVKEIKDHQNPIQRPSYADVLSGRNSSENLAAKASQDSTHEEGVVKPSSRPQPVRTALPTVRHHRRRSDLPLSPPPQLKPRKSSGFGDLKRRDSSDLDISDRLHRMNSYPDDNALSRKLSHDKLGRANRSSSIKSVATYPELILPTVGELPFTPKTVALANSGDFEDTQSDSTAAPDSVPPSPPKTQPKPQEKVEPEQKEKVLPQCLNVLTVQNIDFMCNILLADSPPTIDRRMGKSLVVDQARGSYRSLSPIKRQANTAAAWKTFIEHSFFYVLSNGKRLLETFRLKDKLELIDTSTLQYCLFRISQAVPDIYLEALWLAARDLYKLPDSVQEKLDSSRHSSKATSADHDSQDSLSKARDASQLLTILCHGLIATVPCSGSPDITRAAFIERGTGACHIRQGPGVEYSLEVNDAVSNELAQRLADRIFKAIPMLKTVHEVTGVTVPALRTLVGTLKDHVCESSYFEQYPELKTNFRVDYKEPFARRSATILMDFARDSMLRNWDGKPIIPNDGVFGGALTLITAMHDEISESDLDGKLYEIPFIGDRLRSWDISYAWLSAPKSEKRIHILDTPFLFTEEMLANYFRAINFSRMSQAYDYSTTMSVCLSAIAQPKKLITDSARNRWLADKLAITLKKYLTIHVRRDAILTDSFNQLWRREERELLKPFKIVMGENEGEQGNDQGGVTQEYFREVIAQAMNTELGGFTVDSRTKMIWFQPSSPFPLWQYEMVGVIFGLALYNGCSLSVTFPLAFYRKVLGLPVDSIEHIADGWPELAAGLQALLDWDEKDGKVEDIFCRTYEFSVDVLGRTVSRNMQDSWSSASTPSSRSKINEWPQFASLPDIANAQTSALDAEASEAPMVTAANRSAYVKDYIQHLTSLSIAPQFSSFQRGLLRVIHPGSLKLFQHSPQLLREVVEGVQVIDVRELEKVARYEGFRPGDRTIRMFWSIVRQYSQAQL